MCGQGADPLSNLLPFPPESQDHLGLSLDPSSRYLNHVEEVILGDVFKFVWGGGELRAYQVSYVQFFSAHMTILGATIKTPPNLRPIQYLPKPSPSTVNIL